MAQGVHVWTQVGLNVCNLVLCVGAFAAEVGQDRPNVGNMVLHEPHPKPMEIAVVSLPLSPQKLARVGTSLGRAPKRPTRPNLGSSFAILDLEPNSDPDGPPIEAM